MKHKSSLPLSFYQHCHPQSATGRRCALTLCLIVLLGTVPLSQIPVRAQQDMATLDSETLFAQKSDPLLQIIRRTALETRLDDRSLRTKNDHLMDPLGVATGGLARIAGVRREPNGAIRVSLTASLLTEDVTQLKAAGFSIGSRVGQLATIETDVERLSELATLQSISRLTAATRAYPNNDLSRRAIGVDNDSGQRAVSQTGRGVVVAIVDDGIDFRHLDFTVPGTSGQQTRIKALLDMTVYSPQAPPLPPDPNWNYVLPGATSPIGRLYTEADINAALRGEGTIQQRNRTGHGTHVAGTAAGNGLAGPVPAKYAGIAPEADLIIVKASRQNDGTDNFLDVDQINALAFIQQKASELGEPFVINMSMAGHFGPHDGTRANERAIDQIVNAGPGRAVCVSGGSTGDMHAHASGILNVNTDLNLQINLRNSTQLVWLSYAREDNVTVKVTRADGVQTGAVAYNANQAPGFSNPFMDVYNTLDDKRDSDPQNDEKAIIVLLKPGATALGPSPHTWTITLNGDSIVNGHFDAWASLEGDFITNVDDTHQTTVPGTARGAITVAGNVTRAGDRAIGDYASFSSQGPTADGRLKPDISAPAFSIFSSKAAGSLFFTSPLASDSNFHVGAFGNSFATPAVTGAVALLFQVNPQLTTGQLKEIIGNTATRDSFTGQSAWNKNFGAGKLNIAEALRSIQPSGNANDDARFFVRQHYLDFLNRPGDQSGVDFWTNEITSCGSDVECIEVKRINASAAFFLSIEFQETGYLVYRIHKASFGNLPGGAPVPIRREQFTPDVKQIAQDVVANQTGWEQVLENNKRAFVEEFGQRSAFTLAYPTSMSQLQFVDTLNANAGGALSITERDQLVTELTSGTRTRAQALRAVAEDPDLYHAELNRAFVLMQYSGYLLRNPNDAPESTLDFQGYHFWLNKLNAFNGNFVNAEMVKAFISSSEYRKRFGP